MRRLDIHQALMMCEDRQVEVNASDASHGVRLSMCPRSRAGKVPRSPELSFRSGFLNGIRLSKCLKSSCQESVEVDQTLLRTVEQYLDAGMSLSLDSLRGFVRGFFNV